MGKKVSDSNEEPYATIFASLKHPIRRKILRMLSKNPMSFSEMLEALEVSSSFLTYHLENLGELILKIDDGKYKLSSFGEAALATMTKVEDIPATAHLQLADPRKAVRRTTAIALGIICIVLIASLGAALAFYNSTLTNKDKTIADQNSQINSLNTQLTNQNNTISSLNFQISQLTSRITTLQEQAASDNLTISSLGSQISDLNSNVTNLSNKVIVDNTTINALSQNITNLQEELQGILNATASAQNLILSNITEWVNRTVMLEGIFDFTPFHLISEYFPYNSQLTIGNQTFWTDVNDKLFSEISPFLFSNIGNSSWATNSLPVLIYGVVKEGVAGDINPFPNGTSWTVYYIEAEGIIITGDPIPHPLGNWTQTFP